MYIAKYFTKIYICLGSKIPHEKKRAKREWARKKKKKAVNKGYDETGWLPNTDWSIYMAEYSCRLQILQTHMVQIIFT